jgi:hypothetical protein
MSGQRRRRELTQSIAEFTAQWCNYTVVIQERCGANCGTWPVAQGGGDASSSGRGQQLEASQLRGGGAPGSAEAMAEPEPRQYRGVPLERVIEKPKLVGKRWEMGVFNDPF